MERLLAATISVIGKNGLAGVSIPLIAQAAGLSTGAIYRRFNDKDALIRIAFQNFLEGTQSQNREALSPERFAQMSFSQTLRVLCQALVRQYREHPILLKALDQFLEGHADQHYREHMMDIIEANTRCVIDLLLIYRDQVTAANPDHAIKFALLSAATLIEGKVLNQSALWKRILPLDDDHLAAETASMMEIYLTKISRVKK